MIPSWIGTAAAIALSGGLLAAPAVPIPAATGSRIFLAPFKDGRGKTTRVAFLTVQRVGFSPGKLVNITGDASDADHPSFLPDSTGLIFSAVRDGRQRDLYRYDINTKKLTQVTATAEDEHAPTVAPEGVVWVARGPDRRLWRYTLDGSKAEPVTGAAASLHVNACGAISADRVGALVPGVDGQPPSVQLVEVGTGASEHVEHGTGTWLRVRPRDRALTFVRTGATDEPMVVQADPVTGRVTTIAWLLDGAQAMAWTPAGGLIMSAGAKLFLWEDVTDRWIEVGDFGKAGVTTITWVDVSPDGRWIAISDRGTR